MAEAALTLPDDIVSWIEDETGGKVTATNRVPGGASREAWFIDVERDGTIDPLFLRYSRAERPDDTAFLPLRVEAEVFMALQDTDVTVPRTLAVHPEHEAMLSERISGENWFYRIQDPDEQVRVAQDFIRNLAALHRLDPHDLALPSFGPVKTVREHALDEIANMRRRRRTPSGDIDPLVRLSLDWLERNVPDYDGPVVLVQGDTGPGNFMYENGKVTAVVDWELAHSATRWTTSRGCRCARSRTRSRTSPTGCASTRSCPATRSTRNESGTTASSPRPGSRRTPRARARLGVGAPRRPARGARHRERDHLRDAAPAPHHRGARGRDGLRAPAGRPARRTATRAVARVLRRDARQPADHRAAHRRPAGVAVDQGRGAHPEVPQGSRPLRTRVRATPSSTTSPSSLGHDTRVPCRRSA